MSRRRGLAAWSSEDYPLDDTPYGRSGCCYEETLPRLHALCPGEYEYRATPTASPYRRRCSCRCHEDGVQALKMPTMDQLQMDIGRGEVVRRGQTMHGNWKGPKVARSLRTRARPLS